MTVAIRTPVAEAPSKPDGIADKLFRPMGVDGVYARTHLYEDVIERLTAWISSKRATLNPTPVPVYSGVAQVGQTLTALPKRWGPGDVTLSFQWYRSGDHGDVRIKGATRAKYTLVDADAGHRVKVRVTGRKHGYTTVQRYSAWTSTVASSGTSAGTAPTHR